MEKKGFYITILTIECRSVANKAHWEIRQKCYIYIHRRIAYTEWESRHKNIIRPWGLMSVGNALSGVGWLLHCSSQFPFPTSRLRFPRAPQSKGRGARARCQLIGSLARKSQLIDTEKTEEQQHCYIMCLYVEALTRSWISRDRTLLPSSYDDVSLRLGESFLPYTFYYCLQRQAC